MVQERTIEIANRNKFVKYLIYIYIFAHHLSRPWKKEIHTVDVSKN